MCARGKESRGSVHVDGVEDPLGELLELGGRRLRFLLQPLVVLPEPLDLSLEPQLLLALLERSKRREEMFSRPNAVGKSEL